MLVLIYHYCCMLFELLFSQPSSPLSAPVSKVAELKKLKTGRQDRHVLGAEISSLGVLVSLLCTHYYSTYCYI